MTEHAVLDRLAEAIAIVGPDGALLYANPAATAMFDDLSVLSDGRLPVEATRLTGEERSNAEVRFPDASGQTRWLRVTTRRRTDGGPPYGVIASFADITPAQRTREDLLRATKMLSTAFEDAPIGMALVGLDGAFIKVNRTVCELTGYGEDELLALTFQEITHPEDLDADLDHVRRLVAGEIERYSMQKRYFTASGATIWVSLSVSLVCGPDGTPEYFVSQIEDIGERKRLEQSLQRLADHDALTDLWNRRRFEEELQRQVGRCRRYGEEAALFLLDLDDFKQVNDTLGHSAGDDLLRAVAEAMRRRLRSTDCLSRIGGDEFAVLLPNVSRDRAAVLADELAASIRSQPVEVRGRELAATASIGVAFLDADVESAEAVLMAADVAMYQAKAAGRDRTSLVPTAVPA